MQRDSIVNQIQQKGSFLCVGLDTDIRKIPTFLLDYEDPVYEFNRRVIGATKDFCIAYKPNIAFYEAQGVSGWKALEKTLAEIPSTHFTIADAKRGDIGNTSSLYARTFFESFPFDAVTVAPYMGSDSVQPFLAYEGKWVILLALTSNQGSADFQLIKNNSGAYLYEEVLKKSAEWAGPDRMMYVVGATQAQSLASIRKLIPEHFLLVPGVGSQGGDLEAVFRYGSTRDVGLIVNASRSIIYAGGNNENFADAVSEAARTLQKEMKTLMGG